MANEEFDLSSRLDSDERILWRGVPPRGIVFRATDATMIPFSLMWLGFAVFWEASALGFGVHASNHNPAPVFFPIWGLMFVGIGLYFVFGRFLWDAFARGHTQYALTNRRALILTTGQFGALRSFPLTPSSEISSTEDLTGGGTIVFGQLPVRNSGRGWPGGSPNVFMFERIANIKDALRIIRDVQNKK